MMPIDLPAPLARALGTSNYFESALFKRPESLSAFLPYAEFVPDSGVFVLKDGSLGAVFELSLLEHETMTAEALVEAVDGLKSWFTLPEQYVLQVIWDQRWIPARDKRFSQFEEHATGGDPVSRMLFQRRMKLLRDACEAPGLYAPMERVGLVTVRFFPNGTKRRTPLDGLRRPEATLLHELQGFTRYLREFEQTLKSLESSSKVPLKRVDAAKLVDELRRFFNPDTYFKRSFARVNETASLSNQIIYAPPTLSFDGIEREGLRTRTLSLKTSPHFAYPGGMAYFTRLPFPVRLALSFSFPSKAKVKQFFDVKEFFLQNTPSARSRRQREEILKVQEQLARDDRCLHMTFSVVIEGRTDEELDERTRTIVSLFNNDLECEVIVEKDIGLGLCLNSLPLCYSPRADYSTQRAIRILRSDATRFLPVFDSFRGLTKPLQVYLSRENNLARFSLQDNETSNHTVVLADSGSGKSSFIIDCIQAAKRTTPQPLVFVIDKKSSYLALSRYFDADVTVFDHSREMPFSPFRGVFDEEKIAFLTNLIVAGVKMLSPAFELESDHIGMIAKALRRAYERKTSEAGLRYQGGQLVRTEDQTEVNLGLDDVIAELSALTAEPEWERSAAAIDALLPKMSPFYGDGIYAKFFNGKGGSSQPSNKLFYIYDLDALDNDKILQTLMTMAVVEEIRQTIKKRRGEGREGFVVIEEMQMLAGNEGNMVGAAFVTDAAQTFRKLNVWLVSLTPRPQNYFDTAVGQAMWGVADNFIFLQMSADNVDFLARRSSMLDAAGIEIVKSLRTVRGKFADVFYTNKPRTRSGAFRFFQTPFDRWLAPTNARADLALTRALDRFGGEKWKALDHLAETHPDGDVPDASMTNSTEEVRS